MESLTNRIDERFRNRDLKSGDLKAELFLQHKHIKNLYIELVDTTNRGWKVLQTETHTLTGRKKSNPKPITQYYDTDMVLNLFELVSSDYIPHYKQ